MNGVFCKMQRGLKAAERAKGRADAAALTEEEEAGRGDRAGLNRQAVRDEQAAQQLLTADAMLKANPNSHAAQCSYSEVSTNNSENMSVLYMSVNLLSFLCCCT